MNTEVGVKAFEMKLDAELEMAQARMEELEARAREKKAKAEIYALDEARHLVRKIDKKRQSLREATAKAAEAQSELDAARTQLNTSLERLALRLKADAARVNRP